MWEGVEEENQDLRWLVEGIRNGTVVAVADGSYGRKTALDVSGAGLVLCCTNAEKMLRVSFFERSRSASSGQLLPRGTAGTLALHLLLLAMCQLGANSTRYPSRALKFAVIILGLSNKLATVVVLQSTMGEGRSDEAKWMAGCDPEWAGCSCELSTAVGKIGIHR
jgi:hypothetical protein